MKKEKLPFYKKDLDELQKVFEKIKKEGNKFVITSQEADKPTLSVFEGIHIDRIDERYLALNMYYEKTRNGMSKQLDLICTVEGEVVNQENIGVSDIHVWSIDRMGQSERVYPEVKE